MHDEFNLFTQYTHTELIEQHHGVPHSFVEVHVFGVVRGQVEISGFAKHWVTFNFRFPVSGLRPPKMRQDKTLGRVIIHFTSLNVWTRQRWSHVWWCHHGLQQLVSAFLLLFAGNGWRDVVATNCLWNSWHEANMEAALEECKSRATTPHINISWEAG